MAGADEEVIHSGNARVLMLNLADGLCNSSLRAFIKSWHEQRAVHGLRRAPRHVYI